MASEVGLGEVDEFGGGWGGGWEELFADVGGDLLDAEFVETRF